jgi:hypothetical protein
VYACDAFHQHRFAAPLSPQSAVTLPRGTSRVDAGQRLHRAEVLLDAAELKEGRGGGARCVGTCHRPSRLGYWMPALRQAAGGVTGAQLRLWDKLILHHPM